MAQRLNYEIKDDGLLLVEPPDSFILETTVRIHPESKTDLKRSLSVERQLLYSVRGSWISTNNLLSR